MNLLNTDPTKPWRSNVGVVTPDQTAPVVPTTPQPGQYVPQPYVNPMTYIPTQYTQQQPYDALAPMALYNQFQQGIQATGQSPSSVISQLQGGK